LYKIPGLSPAFNNQPCYRGTSTTSPFGQFEKYNKDICQTGRCTFSIDGSWAFPTFHNQSHTKSTMVALHPPSLNLENTTGLFVKQRVADFVDDT